MMKAMQVEGMKNRGEKAITTGVCGALAQTRYRQRFSHTHASSQALKSQGSVMFRSKTQVMRALDQFGRFGGPDDSCRRVAVNLSAKNPSCGAKSGRFAAKQSLHVTYNRGIPAWWPHLGPVGWNIKSSARVESWRCCEPILPRRVLDH